MYIRLIDSTLRENEYLFRLNDQQKVYMNIKFVSICTCSFLLNLNLQIMLSFLMLVFCLRIHTQQLEHFIHSCVTIKAGIHYTNTVQTLCKWCFNVVFLFDNKYTTRGIDTFMCNHKGWHTCSSRQVPGTGLGDQWRDETLKQSLWCVHTYEKQFPATSPS